MGSGFKWGGSCLISYLYSGSAASPCPVGFGEKGFSDVAVLKWVPKAHWGVLAESISTVSSC